MKFRHAFRLRAPQSLAAAFHRAPASLAAITPPLMPVRLREPVAETLSLGDEMGFSLWLGPLPVEWRALIACVWSEGFVDRQLRGPFRAWEHKHTFLSVGEEETEVVDEVEASLRRHPLWGPVGLAMWLGLPLLFAYRAFRTRRLLEGRR